MNYNKTVDQVMALLAERNVCTSSKKSHKDCYASLEQFMKQERIEYCEDTRAKWLNALKEKLPRQRCVFWEQYVFQLEEMDATGTISDRRLYQNKSNYNKLPASWKQALDTHLENCRKGFTVRTLNLTRIYCSEALLYFTDNGIDSIEKLTYQDIINLVDREMCCCIKTKSVILVYTARMMHFFYLKGLCQEGYTILLNSQIYPHVGSLTKFSKKHLDAINEIAQIYHDFPTNEFRETIAPFVNTLVKHGYVGTTLSLTKHLLTALYLFLDIYSLSFHPDIMWIWFAENRKTLGSSWHQWRRILKIYEQYVEWGDIQPEAHYRYSPNSLEMLPPWCGQIINDFLSLIKKGFREQSTVRKYQFPCIRFCRFLIDHGYDSFEQLSPSIVKDFAKQDTHKNFVGRSDSFAILRGFLSYLGEKGYSSAANLEQCLLTRTAPREKIPDVLTEEQLQKISAFRATHNTVIELRDIAIVLLGIRMGFRASDILNLRFRNIDWKNKVISIVMKKTKTQITLPLLVDVGNALYAYICTRGEYVAADYIFIRTKAPYVKMTGAMCTRALYRILPERKSIKGGGFHVTRRTFATNLLRNQAGIDDIMDALGHRDSTSVMKYLFLDDSRSRRCALSLAETGIPLKGELE